MLGFSKIPSNKTLFSGPDALRYFQVSVNAVVAIEQDLELRNGRQAIVLEDKCVARASPQAASVMASSEGPLGMFTTSLHLAKHAPGWS